MLAHSASPLKLVSLNFSSALPFCALCPSAGAESPHRSPLALPLNAVFFCIAQDHTATMCDSAAAWLTVALAILVDFVTSVRGVGRGKGL